MPKDKIIKTYKPDAATWKEVKHCFRSRDHMDESLTKIIVNLIDEMGRIEQKNWDIVAEAFGYVNQEAVQEAGYQMRISYVKGVFELYEAE